MKRKIVSLSIFFSFLALSSTGIWMYIRPFEKNIATVHTLSGFIFFLFIGFHVFNNLTALKRYFQPKKRYLININSLSFSLFLIILIISGMAFFNLPPTGHIYNFGEQLRGDDEVYYKKIVTNHHLEGRTLDLEVIFKNPSWTPTLAIWVEDKQGNYLQDLYVSQKLAKQSFINFINKRRPEALPVWSHKRNIQTKDGLYVPDGDNPIPDGMSGATPKTNFILSSNLSDFDIDSVKVFLEVNQSFDWNEFYHENAFPEDTIYSGPGQVGQPALVYATPLISLKGENITKMELIGRAHHSGQDGKIYQDLENITTALDMMSRILVIVGD